MIATRAVVRTVLIGVALLTTVFAPVATAHAASTTGNTVVLTEGDDGSAIAVHVGDTVRVQLKKTGVWQWSAPTTSDASVLRRGDPKAQARRRHHHRVTGANASFRAVGTGTATLETIGSPVCKGRVCILRTDAPTTLLARLWRVDVTVE